MQEAPGEFGIRTLARAPVPGVLPATEDPVANGDRASLQYDRFFAPGWSAVPGVP